MELKGTESRQELRKETRVSERGHLPSMQRAALISVAHKLNYALLSCKSIPFIIARGRMLATLSYKFAQQDNGTTCITGDCDMLCVKSYPLLLFFYLTPTVFLMSRKSLVFC